jgi:hypothetical protein
MQDEDEMAMGFSRKMSLRGKHEMLVQAFLEGSEEVVFEGLNRKEV